MTSHVPRRGLGRGLGALIPTARPADGRFALAPGDAVSGSVRSATLSPSGSAARSGTAEAAEAVPGAGPVGTGPAGEAPAGAGALLEEDQARDFGAYFAELPVTAIAPNPRQPRRTFDEDAMAELRHSIVEIGLLQPVVVRPSGASSYELVMGERRWRATRDAGLQTIPAIVRRTGDNALLRDALLENLHRADLNPLEEAAAYSQLLEDFGCTHEELAARIGRSRPQISNTLRLLKLSPAVQRRVAAGVLSAGHARALLSVADAAQQDRLAVRVVAEGISVRGLEEIVAVGSPDARAFPRPLPDPVTDPELAELADRLADLLDTRVRIDAGKTKGRVVVEFAGREDLRRITALLCEQIRSDR